MLSQSFMAAASEKELPQVIKLPKLAEISSWQVKAGDEKILSLTDRKDWLEVGFKCTNGNKGYLLLKNPVPVPERVNSMNFFCSNNGALASLRIMVVITDAKGKDYLYHTNSLYSFQYGLFNLEHHTRHCREMQFSVPGLETPRLVPVAGATITGTASKELPVKPLTLKGLYFEGNHQRENDKRLPVFYFRDFTLSSLSSRNSKLYYIFDDQPFFGEVTPLPYITPGNFRIWWGKKFDITWEVYEKYAGQPIMSGRHVLDIKKGDGALPTELQLAKHIEIPVTGKGTWWVRVKLRYWKSKDTGVPDQIEEFEYRLYVYKGEIAEIMNQIPSGTAISGDYVRIAPARPSLIYSGNDKFIVPVQFTRPDSDPSPVTCKVEIRRGQNGELVKKLTFTPQWSDTGIFTDECNLTELPAGAYEITGLLLTGDNVFDKTTRIVGKQGAPDAKCDANIPVSVPSANELLSAKEPMFPLCPLVPTDDRHQLQTAWGEYLKPFLDHAGELSKDIELHVYWKSVEPLPGVYDWSAVDRFVDYAAQKGLRVTLQPEFRAGNTPEWVPSYFEENSKGALTGHGSYMFHGCRPNFLNSPLQMQIIDFIGKLVERYRSNPAVIAYFTCTEHPGDAPFNDWYEGYSPESLEMFITYCRERWPDLKELNKRWNSKYTKWEDIDHPYGKISERQYLDWLQFRMDSIDNFYRSIVNTIRARDPKRLIIMYSVGSNNLEWYRDRGCMGANGGSHDAMQLLSYTQFGVKNFQQRTEDHSPGNWSQYFPTQMDASLFAMTVGGGANTHCKAFIRTNVPWEQYMDINSELGRYRRFMPIWRELRQTECLPIETLVYNSIPGYLALKKTTYFGWANSVYTGINLQAAHLPACYASLSDLEHAKLVLLTTDRPILEKQEIDSLTDYIKNGGTALMLANYGRYCVEDPDGEWVLLKRLGFNPPIAEEAPTRSVTAIPKPGKIFPETAEPFTLQGIWTTTPDADAEISACFEGGKPQPAITWKTFGKGKVAVIWATSIVPPMNSKNKYAFIRDIAKWSGVPLYSNASSDLIWTNMLKSKDSDTWYGLAFVGTWQNTPENTVAGSVQWLVLPQGDYDVMELVSGDKIGTFSDEALKLKGINVKLKPRELAIYKMVKRK